MASRIAALTTPARRGPLALPEPVLILDFDGTVCVGDALVWAYAEAVIAEAPRAEERIRTGLRALLDGTAGSSDYHDGYEAVAALAAGHVGKERLRAAYAASRSALAAGSIAVSAPGGLAGLLAELGGKVRRMLVTNAPDDGIPSTLATIGLGGLIDALATSVGKPCGWNRLLPQLLADRPPAFVMAVGDIWDNDLRVPLEAGCCTALVDRFGHRGGPAHLTGPSLEDLYDGLRSWAADPTSFMLAHQPTQATADPLDRLPSEGPSATTVRPSVSALCHRGESGEAVQLPAARLPLAEQRPSPRPLE